MRAYPSAYPVCTADQEEITLATPNATCSAFAGPCVSDARTSTYPTATRLTTAAMSRMRSAAARVGSSRPAFAAVRPASSRHTASQTQQTYVTAAASQATSGASAHGSTTAAE